MGMMNLTYIKDIDTPHVGNIFNENLVQSHNRIGTAMVFDDFLQAVQRYPDNRELLRIARHSCPLSGKVHSNQPWHTSASGTFIVTSDYAVPLSARVLNDEFNAANPDALVAHIAGIYRAKMIHLRRSLGKCHPLVTNKKLVTANAGVKAKLPETVNPSANLGHLCGVSFDIIDRDLDDPTNKAAKDISKAYSEVCESIPVLKGKPVYGIKFGSTSKYHSLTHWVSFFEDDVIVLDYQNHIVRNMAVLKRERRTPSSTLRDRICTITDASILRNSFLKEHILMQEFFASQDYLVQL